MNLLAELTQQDWWKDAATILGGPAGAALVAGGFGWFILQKVIPKLDEMKQAMNDGKDQTIIAMNRFTEALSTLVLINELTPQSTKDRIAKTMQEAKDDSVARRG